MRAVLDANVLISAVLSAHGASAELVRRARDGEFELIVSELLLAELERAFAYPRLRKRIAAGQAALYIGWLRQHAQLAEDPTGQAPIHSPDPDDDYLLALAIAQRAFLITGDQHLLGLGDELPIMPPAQFAEKLAELR